MGRRPSARDIELAYEAFNLGITVVWHAWDIGEEPGDTIKLQKAWDAVREIAESRLTLVGSADELLAKVPNAPPEVREMIMRRLPILRAREREVAALIADYHEEAVRKLTQ
jgi:hypothetical protein